MKGKLVKKDNKWFVKHFEDWVGINHYELHPEDVKQIEEDSYMFDNIEARIAAYPDVEFELVQGPNLYRFMGNITNSYMAYAKLTPKEEPVDENDYPIYGTFGKEMTIEEAGVIAAGLCEHLLAREQAFFIAGFQECIKWQSKRNKHV